MKRLSCHGCEDCFGYDFKEDVENGCGILGLEKVVDKKLYRIEMCNLSRDYETGVVDDWDLQIVEFK
jgi:hypothetical protein